MKRTFVLAGLLLTLSWGGHATATCHPGHVEGGHEHHHGDAAGVKSLNELGPQFSAILQAVSEISESLSALLKESRPAEDLQKASGLAADLSSVTEELSTIMFMASADEKEVAALKSRVDRIRQQAEALRAGSR